MIWCETCRALLARLFRNGVAARVLPSQPLRWQIWRGANDWGCLHAGGVACYPSRCSGACNEEVAVSKKGGKKEKTAKKPPMANKGPKKK